MGKKLDKPNLQLVRSSDALLSVMSELFASEINCGVSSFWDCGWLVLIGDPLNGWDAKTRVANLEEAARWLRVTACELYPESRFALAQRAKSPAVRKRDGNLYEIHSERIPNLLFTAEIERAPTKHVKTPARRRRRAAPRTRPERK
jgi:hypothetical protein